MEDNKVQEGDLIYLESVGKPGLIGIDDLLEQDPSYYSDNELSKYQAKLHDLSPHNFAMKCLFIIDYPGTVNSTGAIVRFGTIIRLIHMQTGLALQASTIALPGSQNQFKVCFAEVQQFDLLQNWQINPKFSMRAEGEMIVNNDCINILSSNKKSGQLSTDGTDVITTINSQGFRIKIYRKFSTLNDIQTVYANSLIQIYSTESECYLGCHNEVHENVNIKSLLPHDLETYFPSFVQSRTDEFHCTTLFRIEMLDPQQSGVIKQKIPIRLLNLQTAQYLTIQKEGEQEQEDQKIKTPFILQKLQTKYKIFFQKEKNDNNVFLLEKLLKEKTWNTGESIVQECLLQIKHLRTNKYISCGEAIENSSFFKIQLENSWEDRNAFLVTIHKYSLDQFFKFVFERRVLINLASKLNEIKSVPNQFSEKFPSITIIESSLNVLKGLLYQIIHKKKKFNFTFEFAQEMYDQQAAQEDVQLQFTRWKFLELCAFILYKLFINYFETLCKNPQLRQTQSQNPNKANQIEKMEEICRILNLFLGLLIRNNFDAIKNILNTNALDTIKQKMIEDGLTQEEVQAKILQDELLQPILMVLVKMCFTD